MERIYTAYMIEDPEGLKYFGHTNNIRSRWRGPSAYKGCGIYSAIEKYGWKSLKKTVIADHLSEEDAKKIEAWLIERYDTTNPEKGYNKQAGDIYNVNHDREARKSRMRVSYHKCAEHHKEVRRKWYQEHKEYMKEYQRQWYLAKKTQKNTQQ